MMGSLVVGWESKHNILQIFGLRARWEEMKAGINSIGRTRQVLKVAFSVRSTRVCAYLSIV